MKYFCLPGKHYYYGEMEFWAQGGMCHVFDHRDEAAPEDKVVSIAPREFEDRAIAIGKAIKDERLGDDRLAKENLCNQMKQVADEARFQGDPTDVQVTAWKLRQRGLDRAMDQQIQKHLEMIKREAASLIGKPKPRWQVREEARRLQNHRALMAQNRGGTHSKQRRMP